MSAFRHILVVALFLVVGLGTPGYAMSPGDMAARTTTAAMDAMMPDDCGGCAEDMATSTCVSPCLGVAILPSSGVCVASRAEILGSLPQRPNEGAATAPDPFPPKPFA